jgi:hypothetical protein
MTGAGSTPPATTLRPHVPRIGDAPVPMYHDHNDAGFAAHAGCLP